MAEFLSPGIFIEERASSVQQIQAVSTSNFATLGWTPRGPENTATLITSLEQFFSTFGGFNKESDLAYAITGFFQNGGARAFVSRVVPDDAEKAVGSVSGFWDFEASNSGDWGNNLRVVIQGNDNYYDEATATYSRFDLIVQEQDLETLDFIDQELFEAVSLDNEDDSSYVIDLVNSQTTGSDLINVDEDSAAGIPSAFDSTEHSNESVGTGDGSQTVFSGSLSNTEVAAGTVNIKVNGTSVATDDGEGNISGAGVLGTVAYDTGDFEITFAAAPAGGSAITADYYEAGASFINVDFASGSNGTPSNIGRAEVSATALVAEKKGIYAFDDIDEFLNMGLADFSGDRDISVDLIAYAEARGDVFVILDCGEGLTPQQAVRYKRNTLNSLSEYAAIYYPRVRVSDELKDNATKVISPVGLIAGVYARTDNDKNVGKSPAGLDDGQLNGILEIERKNSKGERDLLYPAGVNPIREDSFVGRAVWGARTLAITGDFTRINARRLFIFLQKSTFNSTHDLVFENIGSELYSRIRLRMEGFLAVLFEDGYFRGDTPEQAYRVVVDESNNPPAIQNARQVIIDIYISVNEPAEFIRFRFQRQFPEN